MFTKRSRNVAPRPLDHARLEELALAYVARFATTAAKLERYLARNLRERGWADDSEPPVAALVARFVAAGYVDDAAYARAKSGSLLRRGYGQRRVAQALDAAGIAEPVREQVRAGEATQRHAALAMASRRGFGPFGKGEREPADWPRQRQRQLAAMLRAGHPMDSARVLVDARTIAEAEEWAAAAEDH